MDNRCRGVRVIRRSHHGELYIDYWYRYEWVVGVAVMGWRSTMNMILTRVERYLYLFSLAICDEIEYPGRRIVSEVMCGEERSKVITSYHGEYQKSP